MYGCSGLAFLPRLNAMASNVFFVGFVFEKKKKTTTENMREHCHRNWFCDPEIIKMSTTAILSPKERMAKKGAPFHFVNDQAPFKSTTSQYIRKNVHITDFRINFMEIKFTLLLLDPTSVCSQCRKKATGIIEILFTGKHNEEHGIEHGF
jgi:hypothetical protein